MLRFGTAAGDELGSRSFDGFECDTPSAVAVSPACALAVGCSGNGLTPGKLLLLHASSLETVSSAPTGLRPTSIGLVEEVAR